MKYDLHVHSNVSDGKVDREEIIKKAIESELRYISFTEHNDFKPIENEEIYVQKNIEFINGIEFDVFYDKSFHMLCYFDGFDVKIQKLIKQYKQNTNDRSENLIKNITRLHNINVSLDSIKNDLNKEYINKRDIIDWLILNEYSQTVHEASYKYTGKNSISYVPKFSFDFKDLAYDLNSIGCKLVLAHPSTLKYDNIKLEMFIKKLINLGLDGIEIINPSKISPIETQIYKLLALKYDLLTSGGSDFHNFCDTCLGIEDDESKKIIKLLKGV